MSFGGQKQTTAQISNQSSTKDPWAPAQAGLTDLLGNAKNWLDTSSQRGPYGGQTYADLSAPTQSGIGQLTAGGNTGAAQGYFSNLINGGTLDPSSNPALAGVVNSVTSSVMPSINSAFTKAGMYGSTPNQTALAQGLANGIAQPLFANYANERQMQNQAAANAPQFNQQAAGQNLQAGQILQDQQQKGIDQAVNNYYFQQNQPLNAMNQAAGIINPIAQMGGTTNTSGYENSTKYANSSPLQQALGMGMMGASMFGSQGMFPGVGNAMGGYFSGLLGR